MSTGDSRCKPPAGIIYFKLHGTAGLSYIEYSSLTRVEHVTIDHAEYQVECQPDQIPKLGMKYFLQRLKYLEIFTLRR